jgi:signal transduction histidine kinase
MSQIELAGASFQKSVVSSWKLAERPVTRRSDPDLVATRGVSGASSRFRRPSPGPPLWWHGAAGLAFGFLVLHPVAMIIFRWLDPRLAPAMEGGGAPSLLDPIFHSFRPEMVPMGLVFGFFVAALATVNGYYRNRLALQLEVSEAYRRELARQAGLLREKNEQLVKLEKTNRRHTQFMVHDFKTHLSGILGFAEILLEKESAGCNVTRVEALTRIRRQALRMAGAVKDLLEFTRLQESPVLHLQQTSVSRLLEGAAADLSLPANLDQVEVGPGRQNCPDVVVDVKIIERVLVNLAFNALKHNRPGTRVVLDAHPAFERRRVAFTCTDDGRGLSRAALASLFQEGGIDHGDEDSTGLGLAFCKAAVEAHGGRIWCESTEGQGARFTFTVPLDPKGARNVDHTEGSHSGRR